MTERKQMTASVLWEKVVCTIHDNFFADVTFPFRVGHIVRRQRRSHTFKTGGALAAKIILGPFELKKWGSPTLLLL